MEYHPILPPVGTKFGNNRWEVYSPKIDRLVHLYSDLEYYHWLKVEVDPFIIDFCEQPVKIKAINTNPSSNSYSIPDMITLDKKHNFVLVEIKHAKQLDDDKVKDQIEIQQAWATQQHMKHEVFTDKVLDNKFYLSAWKQIIQTVASTNRRFLSNYCDRILGLKHQSNVTIAEILRRVDGNYDQTLAALFHLIYSGDIKFSKLTERMSKNSEVIIL